MTGKRKRKLAMPDTLIIVASVVLLVAILSWIIPSGTYDYQEMNINGRIRNVAIDGTYHTIDKSEVTTTGFLGFFSVLYRGCVEAADVIHDPLLLRNFRCRGENRCFPCRNRNHFKETEGKRNSACSNYYDDLRTGRFCVWYGK